MKEHGLRVYSNKPETNPDAGKIICGQCNKAYIRKTWKSGDHLRKVWQYQERYKVKGVGCSNRNIDENIIEMACISAFNTLLKNKNEYMKKWKVRAEFGNPLEQYNAMTFLEMISAKEHNELSIRLMFIESFSISGNDLLVHLKNKTEIRIRLSY